MKTNWVSILILLALPVGLLAADHAAVSRDDALLKLMEGNARFADGHPSPWAAGADTRTALLDGQHPYACVVTCSDSRVSPEMIFDATLGNIFVIRNAGNVPSPETIGSVEYAVEHLNVPVVLVMGHTKCGAVTAACSGTHVEGALGSVLGRIEPAVAAAKQYGLSGDALCGKAIEINERMSAMQIMEGSKVISDAVAKRTTSLITATYSLETGKVAFQTELAAVTLPNMKTTTAAMPMEQQAAKPAPAPEPKQAEAAPAPKAEPEVKTAKAETPATPKKVEASSSYARRHR